MKKLLSLILIAIITITLTACGTKGNKTYQLICSTESKAENEYEANTKDEEIYIYDGNNILQKVKIRNEYEYSSIELADRYKSSQEKAIERANTMDGIEAKLETVSDTKFITSYTYDSSIFKTFFDNNTYLDKDNKFAVNEYKEYYEKTLKNSKCEIVEE